MSSEEVLSVHFRLDEAVKAWEVARDSGANTNYYITGWNHGVIANFREIERLLARPIGTFQCPLCLESTPHQHTAVEIADHRLWEQSMRERDDARRNEILRIAQHVVDTYGAPPLAVAADFGLPQPQGDDRGPHG